MENASDKIQLFTPENIARKIGGDTFDVLAVLKACFVEGSNAALEWMMRGDHSKPWSLSDGAARGDALLDIHTLKLCADLHEVTVGPDDNGPVSKDAHLQIIKEILLKTRSFDSRQFHREEIARWLVAFGMHSEYKFGQAVEVPKVEQAFAGQPVPRTAAQDAAILAELKSQGFGALALPRNEGGKPGVKSKIKQALGNKGLWAFNTVFDKAWERLIKNGDIAYGN